MEFLRAQGEKRFALAIRNRQPVEHVADIWASTSHIAIVGIFLLALGTFFYFGRGLLMPILAATVVGLTFQPLVKRTAALGIPGWLPALLLVGVILGVAGYGVTLLAGPLTEWIGRAPEIGALIQEKLSVLDAPLAALRSLQNALSPHDANTVKVDAGLTEFFAPVVAVLTPAAGQLLLFVITLLFLLVGQQEFRGFVVSLLPDREAKLRFLRIANDVEDNLTGYLAVVTAVNFAVGAIVALGTWLAGFPSPLTFGILAMILNYVPYVGPGVMTVVLFLAGLLVFPSLGQALIAPAAFVGLTTIEGHVITPTIIGRRLTLNPLTVFLNLAFWTWMWGPVGTFLATPLSIIGMVTITHLFPDGEPKLPE
jgi:predicted PurR-regulated permease PerM